MDVNQSQLLEIALNAIGYLAGGGIMLVLASMLKRKQGQAIPAVGSARMPVNQTADSQERSPEKEESGKNFQFINLSSEPISTSQAAEQSTVSAGRRNRAEVYEMARQMLNDKKSNEEISGRLPLSEAELSLLRVRSNKDKGAPNGQR